MELRTDYVCPWTEDPTRAKRDTPASESTTAMPLWLSSETQSPRQPIRPRPNRRPIAIVVRPQAVQRARGELGDQSVGEVQLGRVVLADEHLRGDRLEPGQLRQGTVELSAGGLKVVDGARGAERQDGEGHALM